MHRDEGPRCLGQVCGGYTTSVLVMSLVAEDIIKLRMDVKGAKRYSQGSRREYM
jgi:hypothetical protein